MIPGQKHAERLLAPEVTGVKVVRAFNRELADVHEEILLERLRKSCEAIRAGDLTEPELMLMAQAKALEAIFVKLSTRAAEYSRARETEIFMRVALRAQSQCRATLEAIAQLRLPRIHQVIGQQNIAQTQQVNNGPSERGVGSEFKNAQSKVLRIIHGEKLDTRSPAAAIPAHTVLEAVA